MDSVRHLYVFEVRFCFKLRKLSLAELNNHYSKSNISNIPLLTLFLCVEGLAVGFGFDFSKG